MYARRVEACGANEYSSLLTRGALPLNLRVSLAVARCAHNTDVVVPYSTEMSVPPRKNACARNCCSCYLFVMVASLQPDLREIEMNRDPNFIIENSNFDYELILSRTRLGENLYYCHHHLSSREQGFLPFFLHRTFYKCSR